MTTPADQVKAAVAWTLAHRALPHFTGERAILARGTEPSHYAQAYAILAEHGHLEGLSTKVARGTVHACAIAAGNPRARDTTAPLGTAFRSINSPSIGSQLATLTGSGQAVATRLIASLIRRGADAGSPVNFRALGLLLAFWETGSLTARRERRNRLVFDFYSTPTTQKATA